MKFNSKQTTTTIVILLSLVMTTTAFSQHLMGGNYKGKYRKEAIEMLYKDLGLSQEQQEQLKAKQKEHHQEKNKIIEIAIDKKKELTAELGKETLDKKKIKKIAKELKNLEARMIDQRINDIIATREILTYQQYHKFRIRTEVYKKHRYADWGKEEIQKQEAEDE